MRKFKYLRRLKIIIVILCTVILFSIPAAYYSFQLQKELIDAYQQKESLQITDRKGVEIALLPTFEGYWSRYLSTVPPRFKELLLKKEDRYFYYHPGFNPLSLGEYLLAMVGIGERKASSTLTQQLAKVLLGNELDRNFKNKFRELFYALSLELHQTKDEILKMYVNSVYFGHQAQGLAEASKQYFNLPPNLLTKEQCLQLLVTLSNPAANNPARLKNQELALSLGKSLSSQVNENLFHSSLKVKANLNGYQRIKPAYFEARNLLSEVSEDKKLTLDSVLNERIREIVKNNLQVLKLNNARNAAVVVVKLPENEIISLVGSPDPHQQVDGHQINMALADRPIGSTIKPFIYLKAFAEGLRPYTLVDDREYKYLTALGLPLYPKNYDLEYRGEVDLHYSLSNSLNVPTVKVLEYVGLEKFSKFMEDSLKFSPLRPWESYQLGVALGGLDMSLLDLCRIYTIFSRQGIYQDLIIDQQQARNPGKTVIQPAAIELVNIILQDRETGMEQFGMRSLLNLPAKNYALKTGTSRDYRDSWIIGYTPDLLVGVWVGNADNSPMEEISGQLGAGLIWSEVMGLMLNSPYDKEQSFSRLHIQEYYVNNSLNYGWKNDDFNQAQNLLKNKDNLLITSPHSGDIFYREPGMRIVFKAREEVSWFINDQLLGDGREFLYTPLDNGDLRISARTREGRTEKIWVKILN